MPERDKSESRDERNASAPAAPSDRSMPFAIPEEGDDDVITSIDTSGEGMMPGVSTSGTGQASAVSASHPLPMLVVESDDVEMERRIDVVGERFLVGRFNCDLEVDDPFVSPWHAQLFFRDAALLLQDLESRNGVYLRIADELALEDGDEIIIGQQRFEFRTTWDDAEPVAEDVVELGGPLPGSPARLIEHLEGGRVGGVYWIADQLTVGREHCDVNFPDDPYLSSPHAVFIREHDQFYLRDTGSDFGTFIRVHDEVELIDGDCFMMGRTRVRIEYP